MNTRNKVLIAAIVAIVSYTIAALYIQYSTSTEVSSTLTTLWFSFWTVEIVVLAGITVSKVIFNKDYDHTSDVEQADSSDDVNAVG